MMCRSRCQTPLLPNSPLEGDDLDVSTGLRESHVRLLNAIQTPGLAASSHGWLWLGSDRTCHVLQVLAAGFGGAASTELGKGLCKRKYLLSAAHLAAFLFFFSFKTPFLLSILQCCLPESSPGAVRGLQHILGVKVIIVSERSAEHAA